MCRRYESLAASTVVPVASPQASLVAVRAEVDAAMRRVLDSGHYVLGPEVEAFENEFAAYVGTSHAVGVNSGTDALALTLRALDIGPGDEVITVSHTAVATVAAIEQAGATPVLVDVESRFLTMDAASLAAAVSPRTRAVVPVHLYGQVADLDAIARFCQSSGLALLEDASQAHGARWRGAHVGTVGRAGVFSCYPTKNLGALGDAGVVVTGDAELARRLRMMRQYGWEDRNNSLVPGVNSRLDEIQAAVLRVKLGRLDQDVLRRRGIAATYSTTLAPTGVVLPRERPGSESAFHLFVVQHDKRDWLRQKLAEDGIMTAIHYPHPIHTQPAYSGRVQTVGPMDRSVAAAGSVLSLPMFPELSDDDVDRVIVALLRLLAD